MKIYLHPEMVKDQRYACNCCGRGCRTFLVPVTAAEREAIEQQQDWRAELQLEELFISRRAAGRQGEWLAKRGDGSCVFLDGNNLCRIHKKYGLKAKPAACQLYPFVLSPMAGKVRVGLRFDCSAVCSGEGQKLTRYSSEIAEMAEKMVGTRSAEYVPQIVRGVQITAEQFERVNEYLVKIVGSDAQPLRVRLQWLRMFGEHLGKVKWRQIGDEDLGEILQMFYAGTLAEAVRWMGGKEKLPGRVRKYLGQIFFVLSQPAAVKPQPQGWGAKLQQRLKMVRQMWQLRKENGPLPRIQVDWPDCDMEDLEGNFGEWPQEAQKLSGRYLLCRVAGGNYCGPNFYGYSMVEGIATLILGMAALGWQMRIKALARDEKGEAKPALNANDAIAVLLEMDGRLGYAAELNYGWARARLNYLELYLGEIIEKYC